MIYRFLGFKVTEVYKLKNRISLEHIFGFQTKKEIFLRFTFLLTCYPTTIIKVILPPILDNPSSRYPMFSKFFVALASRTQLAFR